MSEPIINGIDVSECKWLMNNFEFLICLCNNTVKHDNKIDLVEKLLLFGRACKGSFYKEARQ